MKKYKHKIILFSDFACPFCYIGKGVLKKLSTEYLLEINWIPYELHPETPKEGVSVAEEFPEMDMDKLLRELNQAAAPYNLKFNPFDKIPNTKLALEASEFARDNDKLNEFHEEVYKALFADNKNISQLQTVLFCGEKVGLNCTKLEEVLEKEIYYPRLKEGRELGKKYKVGGIPTFILNGKEKIVGSQTYQNFVDILEKMEKGVSDIVVQKNQSCDINGCDKEP